MKHLYYTTRGSKFLSHPAGVRGLKLGNSPCMSINGLSHPAGVRGLKPPALLQHLSFLKVAPRRGAWVETHICSSSPHWLICRTPQGCVG